LEIRKDVKYLDAKICKYSNYYLEEKGRANALSEALAQTKDRLRCNGADDDLPIKEVVSILKKLDVARKELGMSKEELEKSQAEHQETVARFSKQEAAFIQEQQDLKAALSRIRESESWLRHSWRPVRTTSRSARLIWQRRRTKLPSCFRRLNL
jgi:chromosome segregation ATPase